MKKPQWLENIENRLEKRYNGRDRYLINLIPGIGEWNYTKGLDHKTRRNFTLMLTPFRIFGLAGLVATKNIIPLGCCLSPTIGYEGGIAISDLDEKEEKERHASEI